MFKKVCKLDKNRFYTLGVFVANAATLLVVMRLMSNYGPIGVFTNYMLFTNVFGILLVLDFGIQQTVAKEIREVINKGIDTYPQPSVRAFLYIAAVVCALFVMVSFLFLFYFGYLKLTDFVLAVCVALQYMSMYFCQIYSSMLKGFGEFRCVFIVQIAACLATILLSIAMTFWFNFDIGIPLVLGCTQLLVFVNLRKETNKLLNSKSDSESLCIEWSDIKTALGRGRHFATNSFAVVMTNQGQRLLMAKLLGVVESAALTSAMSIAGKIHQICAVYSEVIFFKAIGANSYDLLTMYVRESIYVFVLAVIPLSLLLYFGGIIYPYFMGSNVGSFAVELNPYVCLIVLLMCLSCPASYILNSVGHVNVNTVYSIANSLIFIVLLPLSYSFITKSAAWYVGVISAVYLFNSLFYHFYTYKKLKSLI